MHLVDAEGGRHGGQGIAARTLDKTDQVIGDTAAAMQVPQEASDRLHHL